MEKLKTGAILILLLSIVGLFYVLQPSRTAFGPTYAVNAEIDTSYWSENSTVAFTVTDGILSTYKDESGGTLVFTSENFSKNTAKINSNLTVKGYGEKSSKGLWAMPPEKFLGITLPTSALTTLPVEENETVEITGIENSDQIFMYRKEGEYKLLAEIEIRENSVKRGFWAIDHEIPEYVRKNKNSTEPNRSS